MRGRLLKDPRRLLVAVAGLAVIVLWLYTACIVGPLLRTTGHLRQELRSAREQLKALEVATAHEVALREQDRQLSEAIASWRHMLPTEDELPVVMESLSTLAKQAHVTIQSLVPQRPVHTPDRAVPAGKGGTAEPIAYNTIPIEIGVSGGYHQLGFFLSSIESGERPMQVWSLRVNADPKEPKRHRIQMKLRAYVTPLAASLSGQQSPGG